MTPEKLQKLKEKAELWDSLSPILKTIHGSKFERPSGVTTIQNISNASSHIGLLEEESKEMVGNTSAKSCKCFTFGHNKICQECLNKSRIESFNSK